MTSPDEPDSSVPDSRAVRDDAAVDRAVDLDAIETDLTEIEARLAELDDLPARGAP